MKIAIEGCCHGELDKIYETVAFLEQTNNVKVDLLLICGDFQAVRNRSDLETMAVPPKYRKMNTFWKYYSGAKKAPILTIMIGGNHEASNYLQELPYGGWIAPNIYYLGYAGVVNCGGVRIGGMSGIYKGRDYNRGHFEHPPYSEDTKRTCYHVRNLDVFRLKQIQKPIDIFISHDWPRGVYNYGNVHALLSKKKFFREEVENGTLGNPPAEELLNHLKPDYWFSAHLHVKFAALIDHECEPQKRTMFLALDKCLPRRRFLQVIDVEGDSNKAIELELDQEWLTILKLTNHLLNLSKGTSFMPGPGTKERYDFTPTTQELQALSDDFEGVFKIPENFERCAEVYKPEDANKKCPAPQIIINPQTTLMCEMLNLTNPFAVFSGRQQHVQSSNIQSPSQSLDDSALLNESDFMDSTIDTTTINTTLETTGNPDEISLDDLDDDNVEDELGDDVITSSPIPHCSRLSLPPPQFTPVHSANVSHTINVKDPIVKRLMVTEEFTDDLNSSNLDSSSSESSGKRSFSLEAVSSTTGDEASPVKKPLKKFKRRNQSLYEKDEENEL